MAPELHPIRFVCETHSPEERIIRSQRLIVALTEWEERCRRLLLVAPDRTRLR